MSSYRKYLGANIGHEATLWSNRFEVRYRKDGKLFLFLQDYEVKKIKDNNLSCPKPKHSDHMWVKVPQHLEERLVELAESSRKISLKGKIYRYQYKDSIEKNVSISLHQLAQIKPKKTKQMIANAGIM